jgi:hypothetical protein
MKATILAAFVSLAAIIGVWLGLQPSHGATEPLVQAAPSQYVLMVVIARAENPAENITLVWRDAGAQTPKAFDTKAECEATAETDAFKHEVQTVVDSFTKSGIKVVVEHGCLVKPDGSI